MNRKKGFTLIELMVVVLIVGILAAVAVPMLTGRINAAKWTEGKAGAGTIATALRAYAAEHGADGTYPPDKTATDKTGLGLRDVDFDGKYFTLDDYTIDAAYDDTTGALTYTIEVAAPTGLTGGPISLDEQGEWTE